MTTLETTPPEVLHAICALLDPKDVAAARLTSTVLADIGAHYLVRQITFYTSQESLDRFQKIANHQVFRQYVESVHFEANLLANLCCRSCWLERFAIPGHGTRAHKLEKPAPLQPPNTVREKRAYARNLLKWEEEVNEAYDNHHAVREAQQKLHQQGPELMAQVMPQLPRLQNITFTIGRCQHALSKRFQEDFDSQLGFCPPLSIDTGATASQLKHIVLPGGSPLRDLRSLVVSDLDPSLFNLEGGSSVMRQAFANLKKLDISFRLPDKIEPSTEPGLYNDLKEGGLRDAISSADKLEELRVAFNDFTYDGACVDLKNVLGEKSFDHLKKLSITYVEADAKSFIDILKRQKALKHLAILSVTIKGSWVKVLDKMQKELSLKHATFDGFLTDEEEGMYDMESAEVDHFMECHEEFTIGTAMQMYVTNGFGLDDDDEEDETNPLATFYEEYADRETLNELHADMVADMSDDECECQRCVAERAEEFEDSDDSMPDLDDLEGADIEPEVD